MRAQHLISEAGGKPSPALAARLIQALDRLKSELKKADAKWHAQALRVRGTCNEALGEAAEALRSYDKAIALDPKVGVKRQADRLRKTLSRQST